VVRQTQYVGINELASLYFYLVTIQIRASF